MHKTLIRKLLLKVASVFPDRKLELEAIDLYCDTLKDIPIENIQIAINEILANNKFFPTIAEIREKSHFVQAKISNEKTAQEAWEEVQLGIRFVGSYGKPELSQLISRAVEAVGGWFHICTECDIEIMRAQFLKMYDSLLKRKQEDLRCLPETNDFIEIKKSENTKQINGVIHDVMEKIGEKGITLAV